MTPKEKSEELFNKYCYAIRTEETDSEYWTNIIYAKQCALIAVEEVFLAIGDDYFKKYEFYLEVKRQLEKL